MMDDYFPIIDENINPCSGCPDYDEDGCKSNGGCGSPQTNADRIHAMTDEELAEYLDGVCHDLWQMFVKDPQKMWLNRLKEEVKDD